MRTLPIQKTATRTLPIQKTAMRTLPIRTLPTLTLPTLTLPSERCRVSAVYVSQYRGRAVAHSSPQFP